MRVFIILIGLGLVLGLPTNVQAVDPDTKCYADKVKETAKYYACRLKAESKAIKKGETPDFSKCDSKYSDKWGKAESKAGGECPTEGDQAAIQVKMIGDADTIVARLSGQRFIDNGDGTITDTQTGLMWEKKVNPFLCFLAISCVSTKYDWAEAMGDWISELNGFTDDPASQSGLAAYSDWRLPTIAELQTILIEPSPCGTDPCIDPIFGPTTSADYWSSTTLASFPTSAFVVFFGSGLVFDGSKVATRRARAVRGGL